MRLFEYCQKKNLMQLPDDQRLFISKKIIQEVNKVAKEKGISKEEAYWQFSHGLTEGSDRIVTD